MTDFERLMAVSARINSEWMDRVSGLSDVARGEVDMQAMFAYDTSENPRRAGRLFGISRETYLEWKAMGSNAKARRRWRRRNVSNSQRLAALAQSVYGGNPPGIRRPRNTTPAATNPFALPIELKIDERPTNWAALAFNGGVSTPVNQGVTLTLGGRVVDVTGQTNEELAQTAARMINGEGP